MSLSAASTPMLPATLAEAHAEIQALRVALAEQSWLARIPHQNPNPVYRVNAQGEQLFANPAALQLNQQMSAEVTETARQLANEWVAESLAEGKMLQREARLGTQEFSVHITPFPEEHYVNIYLVEETTRVAAQRDQAAQQQFTQQVLDAVPIMVYVRDAHGRYTFRNEAARQLHHMLEAGTQQPAGPAPHEPAVRHYAEADRQVLESGQHLLIDDVLLLPDGSRCCLQTFVQPLVWGPQTEPQVLGVSIDVTDLRQATEAANAAAKARENFLANMSHEIRTPLNGVLGMAARLAKTALSSEQQELLRIIRSSGQHLLGVINDVLDMAKISSGKLELNNEPFDLCESMFQATQPLMLQALEKGITLDGQRLRDTCPYPMVVGDAHRINQILLNLLSNAIKFTPAGGSIHVGGYLLAETAGTLTVEFRVRDTGVGIPPDKLDRIFENFTQAYADTSRNFGGTGLGLSISRALVEQMGGQLTVESEIGRGSTFAFRLPLPRVPLASPPPAPSPAAEPASGLLRGKRVLMVEDNDINRLVAGMLLEDWGMALEEAEDGPRGLACATQNAYDVVLMDIQLPGLSGLEVTAAIRSLPDARRAQVPILALTANAFEQDAREYLAAGMNDGISKPFDAAELYRKLVQLLV